MSVILPSPQIVTRKRTTERAEDYDALMDKVAALLLAACQKLGLLQPSGVLPQGKQGAASAQWGSPSG